MFPLMFVMAVAFMVHTVESMRGPPQASLSVREKETLLNDKCRKFGAKKVDDDVCMCPHERPVANPACGWGGNGMNAFKPTGSSPNCRCLTWEEQLETLQLPVAASALSFCSALMEDQYHIHLNSANLKVRMEKTLEKTSPEVCQHALTGTFNTTEAQEAPWAEEAAKISEKGPEEDREYGRMRPVKEEATDPVEKELWEHALSQVCHDECEELMDRMKNETAKLAEDVVNSRVPFAEACANHVVQHVEAEILGCCSRSCGWNGRMCTLWPFFTPEDKVAWDLECCSEMNVLRNSSREHMCNAVLPRRLATAASKYDLDEQDGTDVGKVLIGQNSSLVWTKKGAQKARLGIKFQLPNKSSKSSQLPKKSRAQRFISKLLGRFGKEKMEFKLVQEAGAREGEKVSMDFLLQHKHIGEEFLRRGFFREVPFSRIFDAGASSVLELKLQNETCDFGKFNEICPAKFITTYMKRCQESWSVTEKESFEEIREHPAVGHCSISNIEYFAAPEDCEKLTEKSKNSIGETFVHYFSFQKEENKPIKCVKLGKDQCQGEPLWWEKIPLKSVQELVNNEDVNTYTDLVYVKIVKVKAD